MQVVALDQQIEALAERHPICRLLMTAPIGPVTAAAIDNVERFACAHAVESHLGLTTGEHRSSGRRHRTGITKAGPPGVRRALVQACWIARRLRKTDPLVVWADKIRGRRGHHMALVAMARKLVGILYAMWRDGTTYDPYFEDKRQRAQPTA